MAGVTVDGNDPIAMYAAAGEAIERARDGRGPTLIEAITFRFFGHVFGDQDAYMDKEQKAAAMAADPVPRYRKYLIDTQLASEEQLGAIEADVEHQLDEALEFALESPFPDLSELRHDVFAHEIAEIS
jgi:pyruvate dehydrogenase E1 component alpha subunit